MTCGWCVKSCSDMYRQHRESIHVYHVRRQLADCTCKCPYRPAVIFKYLRACRGDGYLRMIDG